MLNNYKLGYCEDVLMPDQDEVKSYLGWINYHGVLKIMFLRFVLRETTKNRKRIWF
jgi:hypothetical protein